MKRLLLILTSILLVLACAFSMFACDLGEEETTAETLAEGEEIEATGLWADATYRSNVTVGEGAKTVSFTVEAEGKMITVTLKTDKATLGEAMYEQELINDPSFFDTLNGMVASWSADQAYWAFYEGETMINHGVNDEKIDGGESYRFVYTKQ